MKTRTVATLLAEARRKLECHTAALDVRLLLQAATGINHAELIANPHHELTLSQFQNFEAYINRRAAHEPVSRILGNREFYGRNFKVTREVLDPRADTECVVELALAQVKSGRFIDLGTGSGAIAITLCAENSLLSGIAADISGDALAVAKANAAANGISSQLSFHHGTWLEGMTQRFDLIISNPPYIRQDAQLPPDVKNFDPHLALFGGADGLDAYRAIAAQSASHLTLTGVIVVEIGHEQAEFVTELFAAQGFKITAHAIDIAGYIRGLAFLKQN